MPTKIDRVRKTLERYGLRVVCLACTRRARWWPQDDALGKQSGRLYMTALGNTVRPDGSECAALQHSAHRLRDTRCYCGAFALRSLYWVQRFPDRAMVERNKATATARALS